MYIFRELVPKDIPFVIETVRESYGDEYFHQAVYDPKRLLALLQSGEYRLTMAQVAGEDAGFICAKQQLYFPDSLELSMLIIRRQFRGHGLSAQLFYQGWKQHPAPAHYGHAVSYHSLSQREPVKLGFVPSGIWVGRYTGHGGFLKAEHDRRLHSVVLAGNSTVRQVELAFLPAAHSSFILEIYRQLRVAVRQSAATPASSARLWHYCEWDCLDIFVAAADSDTPGQIAAWEAAYPAAESENVFLNLCDPGCQSLFDRLTGQGFYFTGLHPLHGGCEYAMLNRSQQPVRTDLLRLDAAAYTMAKQLLGDFELQG